MFENRKIKVLNLYGGLGGNRKLWGDNVEVTMVESNPIIAAVYQRLFPNDRVIIADAHQYLLDHYHEFDFIWASPPCQGNSKMIRSGRNRKPRYPDFKLYEEVIFLRFNFKGKWVIENVEPYYDALIKPSRILGRHFFWSNFDIGNFEAPKFKGFMTRQNLQAKKELQDWLGIHYEENIYYGNNHCPTQVLRNCVHPDLGKFIFEQAFRQESPPARILDKRQGPGTLELDFGLGDINSGAESLLKINPVSFLDAG